MRSGFGWAVLAGLVLPLMTGCASGPRVIRGQSPDMNGVYQAGGPVAPGQIQPVIFGRNNSPYFEHGGIVYNDGSSWGGGGFCDADGCGRTFCAPRQYYRFRYVVPQGLTYPQANASPGGVQYPYYTLKGPDCFFHQ